jgi:putative mRNA 3-end processing factor
MQWNESEPMGWWLYELNTVRYGPIEHLEKGRRYVPLLRSELLEFIHDRLRFRLRSKAHRKHRIFLSLGVLNEGVKAQRRADILVPTTKGLYCPAGDFYVDPWGEVERAVITHGHSDHAHFGSRRYLAHPVTAAVMMKRLGAIVVDRIPYGMNVRQGEATISLHPAGHIPGAAQVRIEVGGRIWVVTGDHKLELDRISAPFEPVRCHTLITESTFGLPIYRWRESHTVESEIAAWWKENAEQSQASILFVYSLGKAQRILKAMSDKGIGRIFGHGATVEMTNVLRNAGVALPPLDRYVPIEHMKDRGRALVLAPQSVEGTPWLRQFEPHSRACASGWMMIRGIRRRRGIERGFVVSDHSDFPALLDVVRRSEAERVLPTHGYTESFARYLRDQGLDAHPLEARFNSREGGEEEA